MAALSSVFAARVTSLRAVSNGSKVTCKASWAPGAKSPEWLDGSLPGDYGFDPLGFGKSASNLERFVEAELLHARWAMLAVSGVVAVELEPNVQESWLDVALWPKTGDAISYVGEDLPYSLAAVVGIQFVTMTIAELYRAAEPDAELRKYPGGAFDPLGLSDSEDIATLKVKEIANGRVAMLAIAGVFLQSAAGQGTPLEALSAHLSDPGHNNIVTSGALPWVLYGLDY
mmetsp:Transcript_5163/g.18909  ORF Transcript_5163/g.18909 Transcript_5163/m.18909 type:complete len:229 (+) Transcript_5163:103-789(+)